MPTYTKYNIDGKILQTVSCPAFLRDAQVQTGELIIDGDCDTRNDYIKDGKITKRPAMSTVIDKTTITADTSDKATITKVPKGTKVIIAGVDQGTCDDGTVEIKADFKGSYKVKLVCWPYLDKEIIVDAS